MHHLLDMREVGAHGGGLPSTEGCREERGGRVLGPGLLEEAKGLPHCQDGGGSGRGGKESRGGGLATGGEPLLNSV